MLTSANRQRITILFASAVAAICFWFALNQSAHASVVETGSWTYVWNTSGGSPQSVCVGRDVTGQ